MRSLIYVHSAVDAQELAGLIIEPFQIFTVPVEIWGQEQVGPQVYTVSDRNGRLETPSWGLKTADALWAEPTLP